jgi:Na+/melibiose symporter-like transporter
MARAGERHSNLTLSAFAAPCLPLAALGLPLVVHLPPYYHSEIGLSLATVGTAWMVVRLLDLGFDPIFGGSWTGPAAAGAASASGSRWACRS